MEIKPLADIIIPYSGYNNFEGINVHGFRGLLHVLRTFIPNITMHIHAERLLYSAKIKTAKTFLTVIPRKFIPSKYTRYIRQAYSVAALFLELSYNHAIKYPKIAL